MESEAIVLRNLLLTDLIAWPIVNAWANDILAKDHRPSDPVVELASVTTTAESLTLLNKIVPAGNMADTRGNFYAVAETLLGNSFSKRAAFTRKMKALCKVERIYSDFMDWLSLEDELDLELSGAIPDGSFSQRFTEKLASDRDRGEVFQKLAPFLSENPASGETIV